MAALRCPARQVRRVILAVPTPESHRQHCHHSGRLPAFSDRAELVDGEAFLDISFDLLIGDGPSIPILIEADAAEELADFITGYLDGDDGGDVS